MEITLSTGTESRIKMYVLVFYQNPTNYNIFGDRSSVCLVNFKCSALKQSLVSIQVILEADAMTGLDVQEI